MATLKRRIMAPGPVEIPPETLIAAAAPGPHHRTREFRLALQEALAGLRRILDTTGPVMPLATSGTGAMEACVVSLFSPGEEVLVTVCGNFSQRWAEICEAYGLLVHRIESAWGEPVNVKELETKLKRHDTYAGVFTILSETSTGVENDIQGIGEAVARSRAILVVDGVSGIGALPFHMDAWHVDALAIGSQKALMVPPGLGLVALSAKARERLAGAKIPRYYLSLQKALKALEAEDLPDTPFTPPVSLILQLRESIRAIEREGLEKGWARQARLGNAVRAAVQAMNLKLLVGPGASNVLPAVECEKGPDAKAVVKRLRDDWGISIVGGQGKLKGRIFRIGHVGYVDEVDVLGTIAAIEMVLRRLGWACTPGAGVAAAEAVFLAGDAPHA